MYSYDALAIYNGNESIQIMFNYVLLYFIWHFTKQLVAELDDSQVNNNTRNNEKEW